jgi:hypothetical protein
VRFFWLTFFLLGGRLFSYSQSLEDCRKWYDLGISEEDYAVKLERETAKWSQKSGIQSAYWAASKTLLAKHAWNPATKLSLLDEAETKMNRCIQQNPESLEMRYLRFSYERNLPTFLQWGNHTKEDIEKMIFLFRQGKYQEFPSSLVRKMRDSVLLFGSCSEKDRKFLKSLPL